MVWWGDAVRGKKDQAALDIFQQDNPNIVIKTEYQDSGRYKDKLATRMAAGDPPALMAMRGDAIRDYADRGALLDLNQHKDVVKFDQLSADARELGAVGDKNFGIPSGLNAISYVVTAPWPRSTTSRSPAATLGAGTT